MSHTDPEIYSVQASTHLVTEARVIDLDISHTQNISLT